MYLYSLVSHVVIQNTVYTIDKVNSLTVYIKQWIVYNRYIVKLREREGQRVYLGRSLKGHLKMVDGGWWISFP